ncbi:MAG: hypothetical protein U0Q12_20080 [Vicinamibacterales bacterium]
MRCGVRSIGAGALLGAAMQMVSVPGFAQPTGGAARVEPGLAITAETFCSDTKLRTSNARLRWTATRAAAADVASVAGQRLEVTVYKNGFDKGLLATLALDGATPERPVQAVVAPQARQATLRAFQIRVIAVEQVRAIAEGSLEMTAVVEDLEPDVNYTWRVVMGTGASRVVSAPTTVRALACPADLVGAPPAPRRRR